MAKKNIDQRVHEADAKLADLKAKQRKQKRTEDTRRKILVGAFVLNKIEKQPDTKTAKGLLGWFQKELPEYYPQDRDRKLLADLLNASKETGAKPDAERSENSTGSSKNVSIGSGSAECREVQNQ